MQSIILFQPYFRIPSSIVDIEPPCNIGSDTKSLLLIVHKIRIPPEDFSHRLLSTIIIPNVWSGKIILLKISTRNCDVIPEVFVCIYELGYESCILVTH